MECPVSAKTKVASTEKYNKRTDVANDSTEVGYCYTSARGNQTIFVAVEARRQPGRAKGAKNEPGY